MSPSPQSIDHPYCWAQGSGRWAFSPWFEPYSPVFQTDPFAQARKSYQITPRHLDHPSTTL